MSRRLLPISTIHPGDQVKISLTGKSVDRVNGWGGTVVAVDGVAIRLTDAWYRFDLHGHLAEGERVIPWSRIADIALLGTEHQS